MNPLVESRISEIQRKAAARRDKRNEDAAKREAQRESRATVSPRDLEIQAKAAADWKMWCDRADALELKKYHAARDLAIQEMAALKSEWYVEETTPYRRGVILQRYGQLYRKYEDMTTQKPTETSDETILNSWVNARKQAALAKIYGVKS